MAKVSDERILNATFVQSDFFLKRIHYFEEKYGMKWNQFLAEYQTGSLERCTNNDYVEWAFLCTSFMSDLLKPDEQSPPGVELHVEGQKPERDSGFFIFGDTSCSMPRPTSSWSTEY